MPQKLLAWPYRGMAGRNPAQIQVLFFLSYFLTNKKFEDRHADPKTNKCYKVIDSACPTDVPLNKDEIENGMTSEDVVYECSDENNPGSVCKKTCAHGFIPSGPKQTKVKICKGKRLPCSVKGD